MAKRKGYSDEREYHFLEVGLPTGGVRKKLGSTRKEAGQSCKKAGQGEKMWELIPKLGISPTLMDTPILRSIYLHISQRPTWICFAIIFVNQLTLSLDNLCVTILCQASDSGL